MSASVNKVILVGRLGKDPEVRNTNSGAVVANFNLATDESYKDKSGTKQQVTEWHRIILWNKLAEIAEQYLHSGDLIYLEGKLQTRSYEDQKSSTTKYVTEIVGLNLTMLQTQGNGQQSRGRQEQSQDRGNPRQSNRQDRGNQGNRDTGRSRQVRDEEMPDERAGF
jgi:single-strand DNA-binding protein